MEDPLYPPFVKANAEMLHFQGLGLLNGREDLVIPYLLQYVNSFGRGWCPHQNIAAHYPDIYVPTKTDLQSGVPGLLYDAYNFLGQRVTHVGMGQLGIELYAKAFEKQCQLYHSMKISDRLEQWLLSQDAHIENLRILPWEWFTQIGHIGMLDILFRMRDLGWWSGKAIILLPPDHLIANKIIITLFKEQSLIVANGCNGGTKVAAELFSLQRYIGLSFNAWEFPDGEVVPWQQAGARLMRQWEASQHDLPLRSAFDRQFKTSAGALRLNDCINAIKKEWGMQPNDWYVCLHMRDAEFYGEITGFGQTHRNASIQTYLDAIGYITGKGGWVIKLGENRSPKLPRMERVIDYARSSYKSDLLDVYLIRYARFFVGTTSGLTNIAISFCVPCALVNCITTDAQLWNSKVRFALKHIRTAENRLLSQRELTSTPWRWRVFGAEVLRRYFAVVIDNSSDEILQTVKEVDHLADGKVATYLNDFPQAEELLMRWQNSLELIEFYGAALPSIYYLQKHAVSFLNANSLK